MCLFLYDKKMLVLNAVLNVVFTPKERPKFFRTAVLNGRLAENHDCRSERQPFERHMERRSNGRSA